MITLVLGGARSGKSEIAEGLAARLAAPVLYFATAEVADDDDLAARVAVHRDRRPSDWKTIEPGNDLAGALRSNRDGTALVDALKSRSGDAIVVSEEVGLGVHPSTEAGRRFRDALGDVNRAVADAADEVLLVVAGRVLPL